MPKPPRYLKQLEHELLALGDDAMLLEELDGFIAGLLEHRTISLNRGDSGLAENVIHFRIGGDLRCRSRIPLIFASVW